MFFLVSKFTLVFLLQEIIWTLTQINEDKVFMPDFDVVQYGVQRFKQYHRNKYNILHNMVV